MLTFEQKLDEALGIQEDGAIILEVNWKKAAGLAGLGLAAGMGVAPPAAYSAPAQAQVQTQEADDTLHHLQVLLDQATALLRELQVGVKGGVTGLQPKADRADALISGAIASYESLLDAYDKSQIKIPVELTNAIKRATEARKVLRLIRSEMPEGVKDSSAPAALPRVTPPAQAQVVQASDEERTKKDPQLAFQYAKEVVKGKWLDGEEAIKQHPGFIIRYAREVLGTTGRDRWPEGEKALIRMATNPPSNSGVWIGQYPIALDVYAREILGGRWPEAEKIILNHKHATLDFDEYAKPESFLVGIPGFGKQLEGRYQCVAVLYARDVIKGRWPELEKRILADKNVHWAFEYARDIVKGRWLEAEALIKADAGVSARYKDMLKGK